MRADKVRIGAIVYEVVEVEGLASEGQALAGDVQHSECRIRIEARNAAQEKRQTLWHEVVHVILTQVGRKKVGADEELVDALAYGIVGVLRDNPWLGEVVE